MVFKYDDEITGIENCPLPGAQGKTMVAWHAVWQPVSDSKNFLPALKKNPARRLPPGKSACNLWSLSMFGSEVQIVQFMQEIFKNIKNAGNTIGTHYACGPVTPSDGLCGSSQDNGHFEFHEAQDAKCFQSFTIQGSL